MSLPPELYPGEGCINGWEIDRGTIAIASLREE